MVRAIRIMLKSQRGHVLALRIELESLPLSHIVFRPFQGDAGKVCQHLVCLDSGKMFFNELIALRFFPFADVGRFLYVLPVDSVEPNVVCVVVYVYAVVLGFPHLALCP